MLCFVWVGGLLTTQSFASMLLSMSATDINDGESANDINKTSILRIQSYNTMGLPDGKHSAGSILITIKWDGNSSYQFYLVYSYLEIYYRKKVSNIWSDWAKVSLG